jgi:7-carboxy-7-deazaguanine synthase
VIPADSASKVSPTPASKTRSNMQNNQINISEIFYSIQGEGLLAGRPGVFIRLAGCPLRCKYCDTEYARDLSAGSKMSIDEIMKKVTKFLPVYAVITGGEPMISPHIAPLCQKVKEQDIHITIETAGIKFITDLACDLMSISPKLSNAHNNEPDKTGYLKIDQLRELTKNYDYQLKFVMEKIEDITEVHQLLDDLKDIDRSKVLLMPQARNLSQYLKIGPLIAEMCKANGFIFSPRLQLILGENKLI